MAELSELAPHENNLHAREVLDHNNVQYYSSSDDDDEEESVVDDTDTESAFHSERTVTFPAFVEEGEREEERRRKEDRRRLSVQTTRLPGGLRVRSTLDTKDKKEQKRKKGESA